MVVVVVVAVMVEVEHNAGTHYVSREQQEAELASLHFLV